MTSPYPQLRRRDEIDELILKINPVVLGAGIPLFAEGFAPEHLRLVGSRTFETGTIMATYARV